MLPALQVNLRADCETAALEERLGHVKLLAELSVKIPAQRKRRRHNRAYGLTVSPPQVGHEVDATLITSASAFSDCVVPADWRILDHLSPLAGPVNLHRPLTAVVVRALREHADRCLTDNYPQSKPRRSACDSGIGHNQSRADRAAVELVPTSTNPIQ